MNIFEKMSEATARISRVAKNLNVGVGKAQYKAVGEADVLNAVKPIEKELGIYSYPYSRRVIQQEVYTTSETNDYGTKEKNTFFCRIETVYRFVNIEKPDEYIDITTYGDGIDPQDKGVGKAMTYGDKYALLKAYKIETGEDPDQHASEDMEIKKTILGGETVLKGGKYSGKTINEVFAIDPEYCQFCAVKSTSFEMRENFKKVLKENGIKIESEV